VNDDALGGGLGLAAVMIVFLVFSIVLSITRNKIVAIIYVIFLKLAFIIFIAIGAGLMYGKTYATNYID